MKPLFVYGFRYRRHYQFMAHPDLDEVLMASNHYEVGGLLGYLQQLEYKGGEEEASSYLFQQYLFLPYAEM